MRNFDEMTIIDAVIDRLSGASDQRTAEVSAALVRHLHAFVREVRPTFEEMGEGDRVPDRYRKPARSSCSFQTRSASRCSWMRSITEQPLASRRRRCLGLST